MYPKKTAILLTVLYIAMEMLSALPLDHYLDSLSAEQKTRLLEKKELVVYSDGAPTFALMPPVALSGALREEFSEMDANVNDEALFILPRPEEEDPLLHIHNALRQVSSLSGITYHSNHYREWRILFDNVFRVEKIGDKTAMEEETVQAVPAEERIIIHLEDVNFGSGYYEVVYFNSGSETSFGLKNLTSLKYRGIPVISAQSARFQMIIIPTDEHLLVYGVCGVKAGGLVRRMIHIPSSFFTRMKALRDWFTRQIITQP